MLCIPCLSEILSWVTTSDVNDELSGKTGKATYSMLLVRSAARVGFGAKSEKKKKKRGGVLIDWTATARMKRPSVLESWRTAIIVLAVLHAARRKNVNAFAELRSASREDSSASFHAVVPKAVEKVVVQVQNDPKPWPTAVRYSASHSDVSALDFSSHSLLVVL